MSNIDFLHLVRQFELECALRFFPSPDAGPILDIGAGTGRQAQLLAAYGFRVIAVDIADSAYQAQQVYPITEYDGRNLPVASRTIAVVFSSNVLEHIVDIDDFLDEIGRVVGPGGLAIHILPTPTWRFWNIIGHYGWLGKRLFAGLFQWNAKNPIEVPPPQIPTSWRGIVSTLFPLRHGERGMTLTEMYYYSCYWWTRQFEANGFRVLTSYPTGIFYSGAYIFGERLSIDCRQRLSRVLGSSCRVYVLRHL